MVGNRQTDQIEYFSPLNRLLQKFGTYTVRQLSGTVVHDAPSGFRTYSREAALRHTVLSRLT